MAFSPVTPLPRPPTVYPVLALIVEGFRPEDLSRAHSPFLDRFREEATWESDLRYAPGEQCWGEVFAGAWPERTGALALWNLDPTDNLPVGRTSALLRMGRDTVLSPFRRFFHARSAEKISGSKALLPPPFVWPGLRRSLRSVDDPALYLRPGRAAIPTLFDSLVAAGCRVEQTAFPGSPAAERRLYSRLGYMSRAFLERHDLYLAHLPGGDRLMLHHGPGSPERHQLIRDLDGLIERLVARFRRQWPKGPVLVAGVRGTVAAQTYFDAGRQIRHLARRYGLLPYRDYALLVNRTLVRFWALSPAARSLLPLLEEEAHAFRRHGTTLTPDLATRQRLPPPGVHAGDWIWFARAGVIVYPNDCDAERPRAATGYLLEGEYATYGSGFESVRLAPGTDREGRLDDLRKKESEEVRGKTQEVGSEEGEGRGEESESEEAREREIEAGSEKEEGEGKIVEMEQVKADTERSNSDKESMQGQLGEAGSEEFLSRGVPDRGYVLLSAPGIEPVRGESGRTAWRADLCVTLASLLEVRIPAGAQGRSLLPKRK